MAYINAEGAIDYAIDDNDQRINLDKTLKPTWTTTKDSTYRALLYYNDKPEGAEAVRLSMVYVLEPRDTSKLKETSFDPVEFESSWLSANNRFLNFSFFVKTGQVDDDSRTAHRCSRCSTTRAESPNTTAPASTPASPFPRRCANNHFV